MNNPWISYWRNSLADGERMERNLVKLEHYTLERLDLSEGYLPVGETVRLIDKRERKINENKGITDREDPEWEIVNWVELVIAPFAVLSAYTHTKKVGEMQKVYPFWFSALADRKGKLIVPEGKFPVFIRRALDPAAREDQVLSLGTVDRVDEVMAEGIPRLEVWPAYWQFVRSFFEKVTGQSIDNLSLSSLRVLSEYVVAVDEEIEGASDSIIKLYDHLAQQDQVPELFCTLANPPESSLKPLIDEAEWKGLIDDHSGQMTDRFSLSFSQRQSFHHYSRLKFGEILAINGPPGTGKTTLLQSIVADKVVKAALRGEEPFVVVASSTNNQAITNIIDSFGQAHSTRGQLAERWLPDVDSYALYLPASSVRPRSGTRYARTNGEGFPREIETPRYLEKARSFYLQQMNHWTGQNYTDVERTIEELQKRIKALSVILETGAQAGVAHKKIKALLVAYRGEENLTRYYDRAQCNRTALDEDETHLRRVLDEYYQLREKEPVVWTILSPFRWAKERRAIPYKRLFQTMFWKEETLDYTNLNQLEDFLKDKINLLEQIKAANEQWEGWCAAQCFADNPQSLFEQLDRTIRHEAFLLATHYWEGRWLLEVERAIREDTLRKNSQKYMTLRFRRYAMLTPCLVATFYTTPKFFTYKEYGGGQYPEFPLLSFIDLLIVDEAGQVAPEVGAASFALAKQSLVIGDVKQINPIWKIPRSIDQANLRKFNLWKEATHLEKTGYRGFSAADGSVMRLAQRASYYQASEQEAKGMLLTEHRRCFDEIISYCNDLAYHGLLQPRRGSIAQAKQPLILPAVGYVRTVGASQSAYGSRFNDDEATAIAHWLMMNKDRITESYQNSNKIRTIEDIVGIITPFTAQKNTIRRALKKVKMNVRRMKVGTVHALQGAERPVIIFSMVYGSNEPSKSYFFDRNENMLNVAVSRAQDSFLLFGSVSVLDEHATSPSGKLIRHIQQKGRAVAETI